MQTVNSRLKIIREELGYNQTEFANSLEIKQSYLSVMESGRKEVTLKLCLKLLQKFDISAEWLLSGKGDMILSTKDSSPKEKVTNPATPKRSFLVTFYDDIENNEEVTLKLVKVRNV